MIASFAMAKETRIGERSSSYWFDSFYPLTMKIRIIAPEWWKRRNTKRDNALQSTYDDIIPYKKDFLNIRLTKIIPAIVILFVGFSLIGPMADAVNDVITWNETNISSSGDKASETLKPFIVLALISIPIALIFSMFGILRNFTGGYM